MKVRFWGVRGSTPTPERSCCRYGGNTPCIEVRLHNGTLIILDCGSGVRLLGKSLTAEFGERQIDAYVFITHFHWDHLQGIPFFSALYKPGNTFLFHTHTKGRTKLKAAIEGQMTDPFFPVDMRAMQSIRHFYDLDKDPITVGGAVISSAPLHHPQGCSGYRIEADGAVLVVATDTEPGSPVHDRAVRRLAQDADLLVYDGQYTPEELSGPKQGWGHSTWLEGTRIALASNVRRLVLSSHDPDHSDAFVDGLQAQARQRFERTDAAFEGMELDLPG